MPARPASAAPTTHTTVMTRSTLMPALEARAGLSETALVALPIRVLCTARTTTPRATMAMAIATMSVGVSDTGPNSIPARPEYSAYARLSPPIEEEVEVAQEDGQPDRHDHHGDEPVPPLAERFPESGVVQPAEGAGQRDGEDAGQDEGHVPIPTLRVQAASPPKVTSSPCAKLVRPVVP